MPAFEPRSLVNGSMLREHAGKTISILLRLEEEDGSNIVGTSTDGQRIRVNLPDPLGARKGSWVEIIGTSAGFDAIRGKEAILFGEENSEFDEEAYNMMVQFLKNG